MNKMSKNTKKVQNMNKLVQNIVSYLKYLNNDCKLKVSVHFSEDTLKSMPKSVLSELLPYNCHYNVYCSAVKKCDYTKCLLNQKKIIEKCGKERFFSLCHAGVYEYIYPVYKDKTAGYIAVTGYRLLSHDEKNITEYDLWKYALSTNIPFNLLNSVIPPLAIMLEKLLKMCKLKDDNEYGLILNFLNEYHTNISLSELSSHFNCSRSHISHMFKKQSGMSIREYCNALKLEDAKNLLVQTNLSITRIAFDTGFNDTSYFIELFKNKYKITPLQYRKRC